MTTQVRSGPERFLFGSVGTSLTRVTATPILLVHVESTVIQGPICHATPREV